MADSAVRSNPDISVVVFPQRTRAEIAKPVALLVVGEAAAPPAAHAFIGGNPHAAIPPLQKRSHEIINQSVLAHVVDQLGATLAEYPSAFGPDPQRTLVVPEHISYAHVADPGKADLGCLAIVEAKQIRCRNPQIAIVVLVHGFGVIVPGIGQGHGLDWGLAQPQHAGLGADPDVFLDIFEQVECSIARQIVGGCNLGKSVLAIFIDAVANGSNPKSAIRGFTKETNRSARVLHPAEGVGPGSHSVQTSDRAHPQGSVPSLGDGLDPVLASFSLQAVFLRPAAAEAQQF